MSEREYYWTVVHRNEKQGFTKTWEVIAPTANWAMNEAGAELMAAGYEDTFDDFYIVEMKRGREVGT